ncbi:MAG: DUF349 domain-containing protein, partial [Thiotrichaceae bacterium]|nr:DUF349 domain-containing protein [Thiotrichaceae bacterium]
MALKQFIQPLIATFSRNKLKSNNPEVRKGAVREIPVSDQQSLSTIAMKDTDEAIRCIAINKLNDLDLLQTILLKCTSDIVKRTAQIRLFQLLCGMKHPIPDYSIREAMIHGSRHSALLEFVAANADQAALREMAITRVTREPLLGDIALSDESAKVRQLAAQQISKRSTLERLVKASRRKDKRVYKIVKAKLDIIVEDEERPQLLANEVLDICDKLEKLYKRNRLQQEKTTFDNYVKRWPEISNFSNPETSQRYADIKEIIDNSFIDLEDKHNKENEVFSALKKLLIGLSNAVDEILIEKENNQHEVLSSETKKALVEKEQQILKLGRQWDDTIELLEDKDLVENYNSQFFSILELSESSLNTASALNNEQNKGANLEKITALIAQAESIAQSSLFILTKTVATLQQKFHQNIALSSLDADELDEYKQKFSSLCKIIDEKLTIQNKQTQQLKQQISTDIEKINKQIKQGLSSGATKLLHALIKRIDKTEHLSQYEKKNYHNDLNIFQLELGELSSWKSWAHDHERESLLLKAENLLSQTQQSTALASEYKDISGQIKELRQQWNKMRSHTADELWQKFNNACNASYELCMPFIEQQQQNRIENLHKKEAICEQLENYITAMNWPTANKSEDEYSSDASNTDWIQVDKITRQARKEWSAIGFVDRNAHKKINHSFETAIKTIRNELSRGWAINQQHFEELISKAEALQNNLEDDLPNAINQAKNYQQQWKKVGPVASYQRNKLWKRFRAACDVIFDKRQENIDEKKTKNNELVREKEAICENLEALNLQPLKKKELEQAFADIKAIWSELYTQSKSIGKTLDQRFTRAEQEYFTKLHELVAQEQLEVLEHIKEKAQICTQVEQQTIISDEEYSLFYEQIQQQWKTINLPLAVDSELSTRLNQALEVVQSEPSIEQINSLKDEELKLKQEFCLKYEILTGKESPAENENSRMQMQVELLNSNMGQIQHIPTFDIQLQWYKLSNYTQDNELEERFKQLLL